MGMYKVSILVPIFNAEKYIEKCARSLFEQTYQDLEYVFVNDDSPDASISVLKKVLEDYPERKGQTKIIHNEHNIGCAGSKNNAIENATGEFVSFVDSDDWIDKNAIELLVQRQITTETDVIWGQMTVHTRDGIMEVAEPTYKDKHDWIMNYICADGNGALLSSSRRIIRRSVLEINNIKSAVGLDFSEDQYFMNQVAYYANGFSMIKENVYHYNKMNDQSMTGMTNSKKPHAEISNQVIGNLQLIEDFFSDKERIYYEAAATAKMIFLKEAMDSALRSSSKERFQLAVKYIKFSNPEFLYVIGWDKNLLWKWLHGNYYYRKYFPVIKRMIHD